MAFSGEKSEFGSFEQFDFEHDGLSCKVVIPRNEAEGRPWVWRARFWGGEPQFDQAMLEKGYHIAYVDVANLYGSPAAMERCDKFYDYLVGEHGFSKKPVMEGVSRGGLVVFNWAARYPDRVACVYADAPVCDIRSWPAGRGAGNGSPEDWERCKGVYGLDEESADTFAKNPIDIMEPAAKGGVPIIIVYGGKDESVPFEENSEILENRYCEFGGKIKLIGKPDCAHHPHSLEDPTPIVEFVLENSL